ncbi:MAG: helix-turn-helix transcriptional regulator [Pantoea sp. Pent]|nr:helix-turn-helix transcriptional regulator [Pantoea sp. Pent]
MAENLSDKFSRGELLNVNCPSREVLKRITSRWSVLVLLALRAETLRYMEEDGFIERIAYEVVPPHVEYRLTALGHEVEGQVIGLADWLESNVHRIIKAPQTA